MNWRIPFLIITLSMLAPKPASAQMAESSLLMPTESMATHLFLLNPAVQKPEGSRAGILLMRSNKKSRLDQSAQGDDRITSETQDEYVTFGGTTDLGAGAGFGLRHQALYRKVKTSTTSRGNRPPAEELQKVQHTSARLFVELTDQIRAGVAIRYLFRDMTILGNSNLAQSETTRYKTTLFGYGSGFTANFGQGAVSYTYFPPLRGKSDIYGEEFIIVEPGEIVLDGAYQMNPKWTLGLLLKRWINEVDDRAGGTTALDNETDISLYGLDPDQYLVPKQLLMIGADFEINAAWTVKGAIGQEEAGFNFRDYRRYNGVGVRSRGRSDEMIKYNRIRAMVRFIHNNLEFDGGINIFSRKHSFPEQMNRGEYEAGGQELLVTGSMKL